MWGSDEMTLFWWGAYNEIESLNYIGKAKCLFWIQTSCLFMLISVFLQPNQYFPSPKDK